MVALCLFAAAAIAAPTPPPPLPPTATLFNDFYSFTSPTPAHSASMTVGTDGAWLKVTSSNGGGWMNCSDRYQVNLVPNFSPYGTLLGLGPTSVDACIGDRCFSCSPQWGGASKSYTYHTTDNDPGIVFAGGGQLTLSALTGGAESLFMRLDQYNRADMTGMSIFQSREEDDPVPLQPSDPERYFIATGSDKVPVVAELLWGTADRFPAGPNVTYTATWDTGTVVNGQVTPSSLMPYAYAVVGVPVPKMSTGKHKFTVTAKLPSGKTYTSTNSIEVMVYAQNIYIGVEGTFLPKNPVDQLPEFIPGTALNGTNLDLRTTPQMVQLNILIGRGSSGTFTVKLTNISRYPGIAMNYPLNATDTDPDIDFGDGDTELFDVPIPKGGAPKVVKLPLYIHDYAASATIEVTMPYRKTTFTAKRNIPLDANNNKIADRGWYLQTGTLINQTALTAAGDVDTDPAGIGEPFESAIGDGLSNFEEYRGFFLGGSYQRFDPDAKDLVLIVDPALLTDVQTLNFFTSQVPFRNHYADLGDVDGDDYPSRSLSKIKPVINPNRTGVPGARTGGQRGVRIVEQELFVPAVLATGTGFPIWQMGILGLTWVDTMPNLDVFNTPANAAGASIRSPDATQFVEVYPQTLRNHGISVIGSNFADPTAYRDSTGTQVPNCLVTNTGNCDIWDTTRRMIVPRQLPAGNYVLNTVVDPALMPNDHFSKYARTCANQNAVLPQGMTAAQMDQLYTVLVGHELGHALQVEHRTDPLTDCASIMYDNMLPGTDRRTWADMIPLATTYGNVVDAMRLWH